MEDYIVSGKMNCPYRKGSNAEFTWYFFQEPKRSRDPYENRFDIPEPQFTYVGRNEDGLPIISGYCPLCGRIHYLDEDNIAVILSNFALP